MNPRKLLAFVCAAAALVGALAWLHAANGALNARGAGLEPNVAVQGRTVQPPTAQAGTTVPSRDAVAPGAAPAAPNVELKSQQKPAQKNDPHLPPGSVTLSVVDDSTGQPLTATFQIQSGTGNPLVARSDEQGNARMEGVPNGDIVLHVFAGMHVTVTRNIVIRSGETTALGVVRLPRTISIAGTVDTAKVSAPTMMAFAYWIDPARSAGRPPTATTPIGDDGQFMFSGMAPGEYLLSTMADPSPNVEDVQAEKVHGWVYVPASFGDVSGVQLR